jgi:hypothetical protein
MSLGHEHNCSSITDNELDIRGREILSVTPQSGIGLVQEAVRSRSSEIKRIENTTTQSGGKFEMPGSSHFST